MTTTYYRSKDMDAVAQAIADRVMIGQHPQLILHDRPLQGQAMLTEVLLRLQSSGCTICAARRTRNVIADVVQESTLLASGMRAREAAYRSVLVRAINRESKKQRIGHLWIVDEPWIKPSVVMSLSERALSISIVIIDDRQYRLLKHEMGEALLIHSL